MGKKYVVDIDEIKLRQLYIDEGKSDREISEMYKCCITTIRKRRHGYNIESKHKDLDTFKKGFMHIKSVLFNRNIKFNDVYTIADKQPYNLIINKKKVMVKVANISSNRYCFSLSRKYRNDYNVIKRERKDLGKVDVLILIGLSKDNDKHHIWVLEPKDISAARMTLNISVASEKYKYFLNNYKLLN